MEKDLADSPKRELSGCSSKEREGEGEGEGEGEEEEENEVVDEEERKPSSSSGEDFRSFILPPIWSVNDFIRKMTKDIFSRPRPHFQISDDIPI